MLRNKVPCRIATKMIEKSRNYPRVVNLTMQRILFIEIDHGHGLPTRGLSALSFF